MNLRRVAVQALMTLSLLVPSLAQDLPQIESVWKQTLDALGNGNTQKASDLFADFNRKVRAYSLANGRNWQVEYLVGSLNCQFPQSRTSGAQLLNDILQNNRGLNDAGIKELKRQIAACTSPTPATTHPRRHTSRSAARYRRRLRSFSKSRGSR